MMILVPVQRDEVVQGYTEDGAEVSNEASRVFP